MYLKIRTLLKNGIPQNAGSRFLSTAPTFSSKESAAIAGLMSKDEVDEVLSDLGGMGWFLTDDLSDLFTYLFTKSCILKLTKEQWHMATSWHPWLEKKLLNYQRHGRAEFSCLKVFAYVCMFSSGRLPLILCTCPFLLAVNHPTQKRVTKSIRIAETSPNQNDCN